MSSEEFDCSSAAAKGLLARSIPVILTYSAKASMIDWMLKVEGIACPVDDMEENCSRSFVERGLSEGRENKGSGYGLMLNLGEGPGGDADGARL